MKPSFESHLAILSKPCYRVALAMILLIFTLVFGAFSFTPAAHAASAIPSVPMRNNPCYPNQPCVTIWATNVNVRDMPPLSCRAYPSTACQIKGTIAGGGERVGASCQQPGQTISYAGYTNNWWTLMPADNGYVGWVSNILIVGGTKISGVPDCNFT